MPGDAPIAQSREATWYIVTGRLKPGVTVAEAQADLATVQAHLALQFPKTDGNLTVSVTPLKSVVVGGIRSSLWVLYGSVSLLLLIACTNIGALLMARTAEREREISIRSSLGASRSAILWQLLTEVFVLALAGSVLGLLIAAGASHVFALFSKDLPRVEEIGLNWRIVVYSLVCAVTATLVCGLLPAIRGTRGQSGWVSSPDEPNSGLGFQSVARNSDGSAGFACGRAADRRGVAVTKFSRDWTREPRILPRECADIAGQRRME